jgi:hypothetical protein
VIEIRKGDGPATWRGSRRRCPDAGRAQARMARCAVGRSKPRLNPKIPYIMRGPTPRGARPGNLAEESPKVPRCRMGANPDGTMCGKGGRSPGPNQKIPSIRSDRNPQGGRSGNLARESPKVPRCRKGESPEGTMRGKGGRSPGPKQKIPDIRSDRSPKRRRSGNLARESPKVPRCPKGESLEGTMRGRETRCYHL